jgi:hypothetical protein
MISALRNAAAFLLLIASLVSHASRARAADIRTLVGVEPGHVKIAISGAINAGDGAIVQAAIDRVPPGQTITAELASPGGVIRDALIMGRAFHKYGVRTQIAVGNVCLSACALAFLGGRDQSTGRPYRVKAADAKLGFHSFATRTDRTEFSVGDMYAATAHAQKVMLELTDYMVEVNADLDFLTAMLEARHTSMNYMSNERALELGIHILEASGKTTFAPAR